MRRTDREVTDRNEILTIMTGCDAMALALNDGEYPYVIEMNFGFEDTAEGLKIYIHGAKDGKKHDLIAKDPHCAFSMSRAHEMIPAKVGCASTFRYESACGTGILKKLDGMEAARALEVIMRHYAPDNTEVFDTRHAAAVTTYELSVNTLTGKRRFKK